MWVEADASGRRIGQIGYNPESKMTKIQEDPSEHDNALNRDMMQMEEEAEPMECPNCKEIIPGHMAVQHTIQCYRNATKCRICS